MSGSRCLGSVRSSGLKTVSNSHPIAILAWFNNYSWYICNSTQDVNYTLKLVRMLDTLFSSASFFLCLNGVILLKTISSHSKKHTENMFVYMSMFSMCLEIVMARCCLKKLALLKDNKTDTLLGWYHTIGGSVYCVTTTPCRLHPKCNTHTDRILMRFVWAYYLIL